MVFKISYSTHFGAPLQPYTLEQHKQDLESGKFKEVVLAVQKADKAGDKQAKDTLKRSLPYVTINAAFHTDKRTLDSPYTPSQLLFIDYDYAGENKEKYTVEEWLRYREVFCSSPSVVLSYHSCSGLGYSVAFYIGNANFLACFETVRKVSQEVLGLQVDKACKDMTRAKFVSYSPDYLYYNPDAIPMQPQPGILEEIEKATKNNYEYEAIIFEPGERDKPKYFNKALSKTLKELSFSEGSKHQFTILLAANSLHYGLTEGYTLQSTFKYYELSQQTLDYSHHERQIKDVFKRYSGQFGTFARKTLTPASQQEFEKTFSVQRYVNECLEQLTALIDTSTRLVLQANTGTGKTYALVQYAKLKAPEGLKTLIAMPLKALVEQAGKEYSLPAISGDSTKMDILDAINSNIAFCTFDSLPKLKEFNPGLFIVDECHTLADHYSFRAASINIVQALTNSSAKVLYTSATPKELFSKLGFTFIRIVNKEQPTATVTPITYTGRKASCIIRHITEVWNGEGKLVIKIGDKKNMEVIYRRLLELGYKDVVKIHSTQDRKRSEALEQIVTNGMLTGKITLTTSVINDGVNIYNEDIDQLVIVDERSPDAFVQFVARIRKAKNIKVYSYRKDSENETVFNRDLFFDREVKASTEFMNALPQMVGLDKKQPGFITVARSLDVKSKMVFWNEQKQDYQINFLQIIHDAEGYYNRSLSNENFYQSITARYDYIVLEGEQQKEIEPEAGIEPIRQQIKEVNADLYNATVQALNIDTFHVLNDAFNKTIDVKLKANIKLIKPSVVKSQSIKYESLINEYSNFYVVLGRYVYLCSIGMKHEDTIYILRVYESNKGYGQFIAKLGFLTLLYRAESMKLQQLKDKLTKKQLHYLACYYSLRKELKEGKEYQPEDLQRIVNKCFKAYHSKHKATALVESMFNIVRKSRRIDGLVIKVYVVQGVWSLQDVFVCESLSFIDYINYLVPNDEILNL